MKFKLFLVRQLTKQEIRELTEILGERAITSPVLHGEKYIIVGLVNRQMVETFLQGKSLHLRCTRAREFEISDRRSRVRAQSRPRKK